MVLRRFINELQSVTVKEVPDKVKPMLSFSYLKESFAKGIYSYHAKYIETDSIMSRTMFALVVHCAKLKSNTSDVIVKVDNLDDS